MSLFLVANGIEYSYEELFINAKNNRRSSVIFVERNEPFKVFVEILSHIIYQEPCVLIDGDLKNAEIIKLGIDVDSEKSNASKISTIKNIEEIVFNLNSSVIDCLITLFTSGTTGRPKKVTHKISNLIKMVRTGERHEKDIWAFAYNPTHMAGLQVFLQAIANKNTIVYVFGNEILSFSYLAEKYKINRISATPTYYRNLLIASPGPFVCIKSVTSGGEKLDSLLREKLLETFPNAKVYNIYASTEVGTLLQSEGEIFSIPENLKNLVRINENYEIEIYTSLLGSSEELLLEQYWFNTGDIVEFTDSSKFRIKSRASEIINVGGYKVNPHEIEEIVLKNSFVEDVLVYGKKNSVIGELVIAEVVLKSKSVKENEAKEIILHNLKDVLQPYKIPKIVYFVDSLKKTNTGKKVRS